MAKRQAPHHRGSYRVEARAVRLAAALDPTTRCMSCDMTLAQIRKTKPQAKWTAGHVVDGQVGGELRAECSPCNYGRGASYGNRRRDGRKLKTSRDW